MNDDEVRQYLEDNGYPQHVVEGGNLPVWSDNNSLFYNMGGADPMGLWATGKYA